MRPDLRVFAAIALLAAFTACLGTDDLKNAVSSVTDTTEPITSVFICDGVEPPAIDETVELCAENQCYERCLYETSSLSTVTGGTRTIHWQHPLGAAPAGGWPVALLFQGAGPAAEAYWLSTTEAPFGGVYEPRVIKALLDAGYAVLTPEPKRNAGINSWQSNVISHRGDWENSDDHSLMLAMFDAITYGTFGNLDGDRIHAAGISSGGYMTSRLAVTYQDRMASVAIVAGSYATCAGLLCSIPDDLPGDHPPVLFLHGEKDGVVPISTMEEYEAALAATGVTTKVITDPRAGHEWFAGTPAEIVTWFQSHP